MRKLARATAFSLAITAGACNSAGKFENDVSKELSKHGPWVAGIVDTNYNDGEKKHIQLRKSPLGFRDLMVASQSRGNYAINEGEMAYVAELRTIIFFKENAEGLDHEIGHSLAGINVKARAFQIRIPGYSGTSAKEIYDSARERSIKVMQGPLKVMLEYGRIIGQAIQRIGELNLAAVANSNKIAQSSELGEKIQDTLKELQALQNLAFAKMKAIDDTTKSKKDFCEKDAGEISAGIEGIKEDLKMAMAQSREILGKISLSEARSEDIRRVTEQSNYFRAMEREGIKAYTTEDEVWARQFSSLAKVRVNGDCIDSYVLTQKELSVFEGMKHNGVPMFSDAVKKYRLALLMLKAGTPPETIRERLEYASTVNFNGKTYTWQKTEIKFKGKISEIRKLGE